ncbi:MAG: TetR/AcrR family transcriptional regulator [Bowdeniella nasicola]|nr:TetR/AcrR family transcriptional regulator [Bowdeniella nasicola]
MGDSLQRGVTPKDGLSPQKSDRRTAPRAGKRAANRPGRRPGPKSTFTRADAVEAALALGIGSFTMRAVAARLGVQPGALYRVCGSRDDLQHAALQRIAALHLGERSRAASTWQACLRAMADDMWACAVAHPESPMVIMTRPDAFTSALEYFTSLIQQLVDLGIPGGQQTAVFAADFIGDTTLATFIQMRAFHRPGSETGAVADEVLARMGDAPDVFGISSIGERGLLDSKIDFIIQGIEAGAH